MPNRQTSTPAAVIDASETYQFEAVGFVSQRKLLEKLDALTHDLAALWGQVREQLQPLGFTGVGDVFLSEDDGQSSRDIKVFVVVHLRGPEGLAAVAKNISGELEAALEQLSTAVCHLDGQDCVGSESWEFVNEEDFE